MVFLQEEKENGSFRFRCWTWSLGKLASYLTLKWRFEPSPLKWPCHSFLLSSEGLQGPNSFTVFTECTCPDTALVYNRIISHQIRAKYIFLKNRTVLLEGKSILVGHTLILPLPIPAACLCWLPIPHHQACWCPRQALCFTAFFHPLNHQWNNVAPWFWSKGGCGLGILCL